MAKILVIDDQRSIRNTIKELLELENHTALVAEDGPTALAMIENEPFDLVICDIKMPIMDGNEVFSKIRANKHNLPVVMISGHADIQTAVDCIRNGAYDFIEKPLDMNRLLITVRNGIERKTLVQETQTLRAKINKTHSWDIIGESEPIKRVKQIIDKVAPSDARVLIHGPNGSGKELVARNLHRLSNRASGPFIEVNCAAIPSELIESELFGHEKGSFTSANRQHKGKFEQAEGGTIFLDEIGDMSHAAQAKVLRALQERKISRVGSDKDIDINVRVVAATNKDLQQEIAQGHFREDLYHRISVIPITVPPLSKRLDDVPLLSKYFLDVISREMGVANVEISDAAMDLLKTLPWTGNIRELRNVIERLIILGSSPISEDDIRNYVSI